MQQSNKTDIYKYWHIVIFYLLISIIWYDFHLDLTLLIIFLRFIIPETSGGLNVL